MTTFKATVKKQRSDGFYTVYIRITHLRKSSYIKTNKIVDAAHVTKSGELKAYISFTCFSYQKSLSGKVSYFLSAPIKQ